MSGLESDYGGRGVKRAVSRSTLVRGFADMHLDLIHIDAEIPSSRGIPKSPVLRRWREGRGEDGEDGEDDVSVKLA